jgi:Arc/MetJ-type ribon-helix-helix transcriptional regulator
LNVPSITFKATNGELEALRWLVHSGSFRSCSEVIREAIRGLVDRQTYMPVFILAELAHTHHGWRRNLQTYESLFPDEPESAAEARIVKEGDSPAQLLADPCEVGKPAVQGRLVSVVAELHGFSSAEAQRANVKTPRKAKPRPRDHRLTNRSVGKTTTAKAKKGGKK